MSNTAKEIDIKFVDNTEGNEKWSYEKKFNNLLGYSIQKDLLRWCLYSNSLNDSAHQLDHIFDVCLRAKEIFNYFEPLEGLTEEDRLIVYHGALMHDLGCRFNRHDHHLIGYGLVYEYINRYCPDMFSKEAINKIALCVLEHRSSNKKKPSNILSEIVSIADTSIPDIELYMRRALKFRLSGNAGIFTSDEEIIEESLKHIQEKFGVNGYHWNSYPDIGIVYYKDEWETFKDILNDESLCLELLRDNLNKIKEGNR